MHKSSVCGIAWSVDCVARDVSQPTQLTLPTITLPTIIFLPLNTTSSVESAFRSKASNPAVLSLVAQPS